jgi:hypothetical protein
VFDLETQLDLFYLVCGLAFFLIAALVPVLNRRTNRLLPWTWLGIFAFFWGLYEILGLPLLNQLGSFGNVRFGVLFLSLIFLVEFGRAGSPTNEGPVPRWWVYTTLGVILLFGKWSGLADINSLQVVLSLGVGGWAAWAIVKSAPRFPRAQDTLTAAGVVMGLFALTSCFPDNSDYFRATVGIPIQLVRGFLGIALAACLFRVCQVASDKMMDSRSQNVYKCLISGTALGLALILIVGVLGTAGINYLGGKAARDAVDKNHRTGYRIKDILNNEMEKADRLGQLLASDTRVIAALSTSNDPVAINKANAILDRYSQTEAGYGVCYVMNLSGVTIASSNRNQPDSFVGKNFGFRPYFKQAMFGMQGRYYALGTTSLQLGYYTSSPVRNEHGAVIGVAVIKRMVKTVGELKNAFDPESASYLVDPHGIVVLSNRSGDVLHSLWPLEAAVVKEVVASRQFGKGPFPNILDAKPVNGHHYTLSGQRTVALVEPTLMEGWTLYHFGSIQKIPLYRLLGVGALFVLFLALIGFYVSADITSHKAANLAAVDASIGGEFISQRQVKEELRQGELKYQSLAHNISLLGEMGDLLKGCKSSVDAIPVISRYMQRMFPNLSGGIYLTTGTGDKYEIAGTWGDTPPEERLFDSEDCWALRRGRQYVVDDPQTSLLCQHLPEELPANYQCWPIAFHGSTLGVLHLRQSHAGNHGNNSSQQKEINQQLLSTVVETIALTLTNMKLQETARM